MKKITTTLVLFFTLQFGAFAVEGMWIPSLIDMFHSDMQTYGLKLTAEEVYSTNQASLKDAIVQFNGGCTAEIVSDQSLLLTNHHCGLSAIQQHSSIEKNYIRDGFWAKNKFEELSCPWLKVTFVKEIRDVTNEILSGNKDETEADIKERIRLLEAKFTEGTIQAVVKPFNLGNQYYMLITEDFNDIRLVGAPPAAIGKFGGDTDNWVWPRHTGDFSIFRIYADRENHSAAFNSNNGPYTPLKSLPISLKPKQEGDFTMVYGFPGSTDQHYSSSKLKFYLETERPARVDMRQKTMDVMKPAMDNNDTIRIQYTSKQARLANGWKKWIGQIAGLRELGAIDKKLAFEEEYRAKAAEKTEWKSTYSASIDALNKLQKENEKYELANAMFEEYYFYGPEFMRFVMRFHNIANNYDKLVAEEKLDSEINALLKGTESYFKNYNKSLDHAIFNKLTPLYFSYVDKSLLPDASLVANWATRGEKIFSSSMFFNQEKLIETLDKFNKKTIKKILNDPAYLYTWGIYESYVSKVRPSYVAFTDQEIPLMKTFVEGILVMFPERKTWADANSTLRITYGKLEDSAPRDGMSYTHYTTIDGIMQKYDPQNPDFELTDRFIQLYKQGDFEPYTQDGELWVCFTASNHTTGGNSGSPVIDADGNLIGINFDRSWESTMSDFMFDESRCRNIAVDIRYVLWVIDKYGDAGHLVDEMTLIK